MKRTSIVLLFSLMFSAFDVSAQTYWEKDPRAPHFCMQNFNAYGPIYASGVVTRTEYILGYLKAIPKCEVVHLQEVWNEGHIDVVEKSLSKQYNVSAPNRDARIGVMSLFMGDILGRQTVDFNVNNEGSILDSVRGLFNVKKAYHIVRSKFFAIDEDIFFMNTHLHPSSQAVRVTQLLDILQWRLKNQDSKLIVSGDFNADIDSLERKFLMLTLGTHDAMEEAMGGYPQGFCTYCSKNSLGWMFSDHVFDYIFFSNVGQAATTLRTEEGELNMKGSPKRPWSDHYGVRVQFFVEPTVSEAAVDLKNQRREKALEVLSEALALFEVQKPVEFKPYVSLVNKLKNELQEQRGDFNTYFEKYR